MLIAAVVVCVIYIRRQGLAVWTVGDAAMSGIALAQAIGRIGSAAAPIEPTPLFGGEQPPRVG